MKITKHSRESLLSILQQLDNNIIAVARDEDGEWYGYRNRPILDNSSVWIGSGCNNNTKIPRETIKVDWTGDWKDSLYMLEVVPEYEPYSKSTLGELEEKSMRLRVRKKGVSMKSWIVTEARTGYILINRHDMGQNLYTHKEALEKLEWTDGSVFGVEKKGEG